MTLDIEIDKSKHVKPIAVKKVEENSSNGVGDAFSGINYKKLAKYSYYESGTNWVKVDIPVPGIHNLSKDKIKLTYGQRCFDLWVLGTESSTFGVRRLQCKIQPEHCKHTIKTDKLIVSLRKFKEDDHWWSLFKSKAIGEVESD